MSGVVVRAATLADADAMSRVLTASITQLCAADHHGDPVIIGAWTANKTLAGVRKFFDNPETTLVIAERLGEVAAVGSFDTAGTIRLNYVAPAHRFRGVSKALLGAMEAALRTRGTAIARLHATTTAHEFYRAAGWRDDGPADTSGRVVYYPMCKAL